MTLRLWTTLPILAALAAVAPASSQEVRKIPPKGVPIAEADRKVLQDGADQIGREVDSLRELHKAKPKLLEALPDVQIYQKAVDGALTYDEAYDAKDAGAAKALLGDARARVAELKEGRTPWDSATGLVPRGYVSKIDGSIQPYGLVVPDSYTPKTAKGYRLDVWFHGRGENLSELTFLKQRRSSAGEFTPADAIVLHPYGRYCNANRFAGEIDLFEAIEDVRKHYPIDEDRILIRGFSMGGAACWQFAVHHPSLWAAAAPGAGFTEAADFLKVFESKEPAPSWYEQKLWKLYDSKDYAANLYNLPTVAYSGEVDKQKQAADVMEKALAAEGMDMVHIIGAKAAHQYTPDSRAEINRRLDAIARVGRDKLPPKVVFTTYTLRYNQSFWVAVDALAKHWEQARVEADLFGLGGEGPSLKTANVVALTLSMPPGLCPFDPRKAPKVSIDGVTVEAPKPLTDRSWSASFRKVGGRWQAVAGPDDGKFAKRHGLQGPIDDAFMDSFLVVRPTGTPMNAKVGGWVDAEMARSLSQWRSQFRGDARVKDDVAVTEADMASSNLILWGDPSRNAVLGKIAGKLPITWGDQGVRLGTKTYDAASHAPILIYPNPLNPKRYVVVNSGFTFREADYLSNARQSPKLPDFAIVDLSTPPGPKQPGAVVAAGFFDESWALPTAEQP